MQDNIQNRIERRRRDLERAARAKAALALDWVDRNPIARDAAIRVAGLGGNAVGVPRGAIHSIEGLANAAIFVGRVLNPLDRVLSAPGQSATEQLYRTAENIGRNVASRAADPRLAVQDVQTIAHQMRRDLDPSATPMAPTLAGELQRNFNIGQNQGELGFNVASLLVGGPEAKLVGELATAVKPATAGKYIAQGFAPAIAEHLAQLYPASGMGSHYIPRSYKLPAELGGGPLPKAYSDGPFNRLAPHGISRGDMYELHYRVDPKSHVNRLPNGLDLKSWNGKKLGLERYNDFQRLWYGAPGPLKARVGGLGFGLGGTIHDLQDEGDTQ